MKLKTLLICVGAASTITIGNLFAEPPQKKVGAIIANPVIGMHDPIIGSKHDFVGLNKRAGVRAMGGVAYADYGNPCVYCHLPPSEAMTDSAMYGGIEGWNRFSPAGENYKPFTSNTLDAQVRSPNSISLLCLSCHDGTMALDMVLFKPAEFKTRQDASLHMKMNGGNNIDSCGKCHDGRVAHDIKAKVLGTDSSDEHPFSLEYGGMNWKDAGFKMPHKTNGFNNGVKIYDGNVECASCHDIHSSTNEVLLTVRREILCETCHTK